MEEANPVQEALPSPASPSQATSGAVGAAWFFLVLGIALVAIGFVVMYQYESDGSAGKIVGGDAYNYIIIATRGVGFMVAGAVCGLVGVAALLTGIHSRLTGTMLAQRDAREATTLNPVRVQR
jgi:hypothetical protein